MKTDLVDQPSAAPTRKMARGAVAGIIAAALVAWAGQLAELSPWLAWLSTPGVSEGLPVLAFFLAGYLFREQADPGIVNTLQAAPLAMLAAVGLALLLTACAGRPDALRDHPVMIGRDICESYNGTLDVLGTLRAGGQLDRAAADRVTAIEAWATPICTGAPPSDGATLDELQRRLDDLLLIQLEAEANE